MSSRPSLARHATESCSSLSMFHIAMGKLQRQLYSGEYTLFKYAPMFESDFIQISKGGKVMDVHSQGALVTVGIVCTSPRLQVPDVMLLAWPTANRERYITCRCATQEKGHRWTRALELTRLIPLKFVRLSIHDGVKQQLRLKLATGRSFYLQLCPTSDAREDLFVYWEDLVCLLRPPVEAYSSTKARPVRSTVEVPTFEEESRSLTGQTTICENGDQEQISIRSLHIDPEVFGVTSSGHAGEDETSHASYSLQESIHSSSQVTQHIVTDKGAGPASRVPTTGPEADTVNVTVIEPMASETLPLAGAASSTQK